jgi:hypothetical protein
MAAIENDEGDDFQAPDAEEQEEDEEEGSLENRDLNEGDEIEDERQIDKE